MKKALLVMLVLAYFQTGGGTVTGGIRLGDGTPAASVRVALVRVPATASATNATIAPILENISQTDSVGKYRLENVAPGRYYLIAGPIDGPTYLPGVLTMTGATAVSVAAGATVANADFALQRFKVSGRIVGMPAPSGASSPRGLSVTVNLMPRSSASGGSAAGLTPGRATLKPDGTFEFNNVVAANYTMNFLSPPFRARESPTIAVKDRDVSGLELVAVNLEVPTHELEGLKEAWSLTGQWVAIAVDERTGAIFAKRAQGSVLAELDRTGLVRREIEFGPSQVRLAHFSSQSEAVLLSIGSNEIGSTSAYTLDGKELWKYTVSGSGGVDDVWPGDLDGDGSDEVIVGFGGSTGVHVLDQTGKLLWKNTTIGNVWHVTAGDILGEGRPRVVAASSSGRVNVFGADGTTRTDFSPGNLYASVVQIASGPNGMPTIVAIGAVLTPGTSASNVAIAAGLSGDGIQRWSVELPSKLQPPGVNSAEAASGKPWLAATLRGGEVYVLDTATGQILGVTDGFGFSPNVAWTPSSGGDTPLLIVSGGNRLVAYQVTR